MNEFINRKQNRLLRVLTFPRSPDWDVQSPSDPPLASTGTRRLICLRLGRDAELKWMAACGSPCHSAWIHNVLALLNWHWHCQTEMARRGSQRTRAGICLTNEWVWHSAAQVTRDMVTRRAHTRRAHTHDEHTHTRREMQQNPRGKEECFNALICTSNLKVRVKKKWNKRPLNYT